MQHKRHTVYIKQEASAGQDWSYTTKQHLHNRAVLQEPYWVFPYKESGSNTVITKKFVMIQKNKDVCFYFFF